jgi:hypothetical protein
VQLLVLSPLPLMHLNGDRHCRKSAAQLRDTNSSWHKERTSFLRRPMRLQHWKRAFMNTRSRRGTYLQLLGINEKTMLFIRMTNYISICNLVTVALDLNQHLEDSKSHGRFSFGCNLQLHLWLYIGLKVLKHFLISFTNCNVQLFSNSLHAIAFASESQMSTSCRLVYIIFFLHVKPR